MIYAIRHRTRFRYAAPVRFARCNLRLKPIEWTDQWLERFELAITPEAHLHDVRDGGYLAHVVRLIIEKPANELIIESRMRLRVERPVPEAKGDDPGVAAVVGAARSGQDLSATAPATYLYPSPMIPLDAVITEYCRGEMAPERGVVEAGLALARKIQKDFRYLPAATTADTAPSVAFAERHGVCQDFAQIMIAGLRGLGLPAAYVSGYLRTLPPPGKERLVGADATHAWVLLWCGAARGWIGLDPTNGCFMAGDHIITAIGRDYADVSPIDGIFLGRDGQKIDVAVDVEPVG
jgi:transglutaminase-like putative cysteine protease